MNQLTQRQREVLEVVRSHLHETGYPPTRMEIARTLGFKSANAAEEHLKALERKGMLEIISGASRGIRLLGAAGGLGGEAGIPIVGRVAAGSPMLAEEHIEDHCAVPPEFFSPPADYFLRVRGDSMEGAGIRDNDLLAVHRAPEAKNGDVVVARLGDEVTVKRLERGGDPRYVRLLPENPAYQPIEVDLEREEFTLEGISVGVLRQGA